MRWLSTLLTGLFTALVICGCSLISKTEIPPLPEPATTSGLAVAEKELDKATAERLSKVSASVGIAYVLAEKNPQSLNNEVIKSELKLAKTLVGRSEEKDWVTTKKRVESALGGTPITAAYEKDQAEASALRNKLKEADEKYEAEKAKKQAEFNAKLQEREQMLAQEKALRITEAEEARKDKFLYMGGLVCLAGVACFIFGPKAVGIQLFASGVALSSIPFIWGTPYFPYIVGLFALLAAIKVAMVIFTKKPECECPPEEQK